MLLAAIWLLAQQVSGGAMTAWWTDLGPSLLLQDDESGLLRYSLCNSQDRPILPEDKTITAPSSKYPPKNGTALAGTGWWDNTVTWVSRQILAPSAITRYKTDASIKASVFYQDEDDDLIRSLWKCDMNTGYWANHGDWIISNNSLSIANDTGLAAVLLSSTEYRVYYHDANGTMRQIGYTKDTDWHELEPISQDEHLGSAMAAVFTGKDNITVAAARGDADVEVSRYNSDGAWHVTTFPHFLAGPDSDNTTYVTNAANASDIAVNTTHALFDMPAWDGRPRAIGLAVDKVLTRSLFYIGTDAELHQVANINYTWQAYPQENATAWPPADGPKAPLAVTCYDLVSKLRVYYTSGGRVVELNGDNGRWTDAVALPSANSTSSFPTATPSASTDAADDGLSSAAKAGVGVGVGLGVIALGGIIIAIILLCRRQKRQEAAAAAAGGSTVGGSTMVGSAGATPSQTYSQTGTWSDYQSPNSAYGYPQGGGYDAHAAAWGYHKPEEVRPPGELDSTAIIHEMPEHNGTHEMMGEGHYKEAP